MKGNTKMRDLMEREEKRREEKIEVVSIEVEENVILKERKKGS